MSKSPVFSSGGRALATALALTVTANVWAAEQAPLDAVRLLLANGTLTLAGKMIEDSQPRLSATTTAQWTAWERERISLYLRKSDWTAVIGRVDQHPKDLPAEFGRWARTQKARALLEIGQPLPAHKILVGLIWEGTSQGDADSFALWRRLLTRCYQIEGQADDANTAMLRYQLDYPMEGDDWMVQRARVLLLARRADDAVEALGATKSAEGRALQALARVRAGKDPAPGLVASARSALLAKDLKPVAATLYWQAIREAALGAKDYGLQVEALEQLLALDVKSAGKDDLFQVQPDLLWSAYANFAEQVGNEASALVGDEAAWFQLADKTRAGSPLKARALYAMLALRAVGKDEQSKAHQGLARLLEPEKFGVKVMRQLYLGNARFPQVEKLPDFLRYRLAEQALDEGEFPLASRLIRGLDAAPEGVDALDWQMRHARVHVLAGDHADGAKVLRELFDQHPTLTADQADRVMQIMFDAQNIGQHELALDMFQRLLKQPLEPKMQREIYFWMGDSMKELGRFGDAARLYLQSAGLLDPHSMDMWAQSSRFQAAEMLRKGGLKDDARVVYQALLKVTTDPQRRDMIEHSLQQLW